MALIFERAGGTQVGDRSREQQLKALTWTFTRSGFVFGDQANLPTATKWIEHYNQRCGEAVPSHKSTLSQNFKHVEGTDSKIAIVRVLVATKIYMEGEKHPAGHLRRFIAKLEGSPDLSDHELEWTNDTPVGQLEEMAREADKRGLTEKAAELRNRMAVLLVRP